VANLTITISGNCSAGKDEIAIKIGNLLAEEGFGTVQMPEPSRIAGYDGFLESESVKIVVEKNNGDIVL
jgi:hypothetical protein